MRVGLGTEPPGIDKEANVLADPKQLRQEKPDLRLARQGSRAAKADERSGRRIRARKLRGIINKLDTKDKAES